jgi:ArsR family transcriptional regulator, arsenate/arsenite/antimonite-responsive transcriptional repressor / arsenate reductase (thioredoxin)
MESSEAAQIFSALGQESRLEVLRLLISCGPNGLPAREISGRLAIPASTTSFHLAALERAGLIRATRQGRQIIYALRVIALRELLAFLTDACCGARPELCGDLATLLPPLSDESEPMIPVFNVLFLCTRNSARSIMAEAILNRFAGDKFRAYSAGSHPAEAPMPEMLEKLRSVGHDISGLHSKSWDLFTGPDAPKLDFVIGLCDTLDQKTCPDFGDKAVTASWSMPDPAKFTGQAAERQTMLNELYAGLYRRIIIFSNLPFARLDRMAVRKRLDEIGAGPVGALTKQAAEG